jgi:hypothetical protein
LAKKAHAAKPDEQTVLLLREILAELRRLNANLERRSAGPPPSSPQGMEESDLDEDSEELEYFE